MRFHVLAPPHTITRREYSACAFTQKVLKFCKMMTSRGHTIYHYGHERSTVECTEHIAVTNDNVLKEAYGEFDWRSSFFKYSCDDSAHIHFNVTASIEISKRKKAGDFLLLFWGYGHEHVMNMHRHDMIVVEPGIGCFNNLLAPYAVFESYSVMSHVYGKYDIMPRFMDSVIPNYFDINDFMRQDETIDGFVSRSPMDGSVGSVTLEDAKYLWGQPYVLMVGRLIRQKGIYLAIDACKKAKIKLVLVGQGSLDDISGVTVGSIRDEVDVCHIGYAEPRERAILMSGALAVMMPTLYNEPFGGVNVEAQLSGTPVITTDWGAFSETVLHGVTGYRCRTFEQFTWALDNVKHLDKQKIRSWAQSNYGFQKVGSMYEEYFSMLSTIYDDKGFYAEKPQRLSLKWLEKQYV